MQTDGPLTGTPDARHDPLTGLAARGVGLRRLAALAPGSSVVVAALDDYEDVVDTYGPDVADEVLRAFAASVRRTVVDDRATARLGAAELLVAFPGQSVRHAVHQLGRLRTDWCRSRPLPVTFSAGVAGDAGHSGSAVLAAALEALHDARASGRDRVEVAPVLSPVGGA